MTLFTNRDGNSHSWLSLFLVFVQFLLIGLMMLAGPLWPNDWSTRGMMVLGLVSGVWSFLSMGLGNIRAFPEIPESGRLVVQGPYRWVRHPMYTSLLLITLAWVLANPFPYRLILWVGLAVTLWVKLNYEEQLLLERFPSYEEYRRGTKRIIPFLLWVC